MKCSFKGTREGSKIQAVRYSGFYLVLTKSSTRPKASNSGLSGRDTPVMIWTQLFAQTHNHSYSLQTRSLYKKKRNLTFTLWQKVEVHPGISKWLFHLSSKPSHLLIDVTSRVTAWTGWHQFYLWSAWCQLHPSPNWLVPTVFPRWAGPLLVGFRTQWLH